MKIFNKLITQSSLLLSLLGLFLVVAFVTMLPVATERVFWQKPLVGFVFTSICSLGILAGIFPSRCSGSHHSKFIDPEYEQARRGVEGHHPNCGSFDAHIIRIGKRVICAGCFGLILGATFAIFGATIYFFGNIPYSNYWLLFWIGFIGVFCGLLQYHFFNWGKSSIHIIVNTYFVLGTLLLLTSIDAIIGSLLVNGYLLMLTIFWIFTRIQLSQLDHSITCSICNVENCVHKSKF